MSRFSNKLWLQRLVNAELRTKTIGNFKELLRQRQEIESRIDILKSSLEKEFTLCDETADRLDDVNKLHEM
jgi:hypothetical protein